MKNWMDEFFGDNPRAVRRDLRVRVSKDADGNPLIQPIDAEAYVLSPSGESIDRLEVTQEQFYDCGCSRDKPKGGQCAESGCGKISCSECHGRCSVCKKPICLECSEFYSSDEHDEIRLCMDCKEEYERKQRIHNVFKGILKPATLLKEWKANEGA